MREKDRRCGQAANSGKVKIRLAPLPTRNLSIGNSMHLEECLNRSVQMDRPLSRMSDLSNLSGHSMISVSRSNYEHQTDELRRSRNRDVIEALRMKDIRRRRANYLNENADNRSVDLAFNAKRKRGAYDEDEESELDCLFHKQGRAKFARGMPDNLQVTHRNRFVSAQYKNNEIASSYFSMGGQQPRSNSLIGNSTNSNQQPRARGQLGGQFSSGGGQLNFSPCRPIQPRAPIQDPNDSKRLFKVPTITISNSSSKENLSNQSLSNASISPISRKSDRSAGNSSSVLFKSLDGSSAMRLAEPDKTENSHSEFMEACTSPAKNEPQSSHREEAAPSTSTDKNDNPKNTNYKIPEYFHSIDEHIRDENKAKSRLGAFLKAIYNVTSPFMSKGGSNETADKANTMTTNTASALPAFPASTITSSTANKANDSILKLSSLEEPTKLNSTSTPLKVTFNLPSSTTTTVDKSKADLSSVFKFGQTNDQPKAKTDSTSAASSTSMFTFGATADKNADKSKQEPNKSSTTLFPLPSTPIISTALTNSNQPDKNAPPSFPQETTSKTAFAISLPTTSSFNPPAPTANTSAVPNSIFAFGQTATTTEKATPQPDANKSSSFVFKFGSEQSTTNSNGSAINSTLKPAPVFNFGQSSAAATSNNLNSSKLSSSSFSFGESNQNDANSSLLKPVVPSTAFTFGSDLNKQQQNSTLLAPASKPAATASSSLFSFGNLDNTASMFKAPSTTFKFGSTEQQSTKPSMPNFSFGATDKPKEANPLLSSSSNNNPLLNNSLAKGSAGFKFNLNPTLNTGLTSNLASNNNSNKNATTGSSAFNFGASNNLNSFGAGQQPQNAPSVFKFDASSAQTKPSFNFGGGGGGSSSTPSNPPAASFNFGASTSAFGSTANDSTFTASNFSSTGNMFTMGRK